jgi:hypothetical protein
MEKIKWFTKELDPNVLYNDMEQLFTQCGWPFVIAESKVIPNGLFWSSLVGIVMQRSIEYSATPMQDKCSTDITKATSYGGYNYETNMLILGLMALSWLKVNIKKKTENGHCRNPTHNPTKNKPAGCSIGSKFHKALYDDYESLLENFINIVKNNTPVPITSSKENGTERD